MRIEWFGHQPEAEYERKTIRLPGGRLGGVAGGLGLAGRVAIGLAVLFLAAMAWEMSQPLQVFDLTDPWCSIRRVALSQTSQARALRAEIRNGPKHLKEAREAAAKAGILLDPSKMQAPDPGPALNAADDYVALKKLLDSKQGTDSEQTKEGHWYAETAGSLTPAQWDTLKVMMAHYADVFRLIDRATDKPVCIFRRDYRQGPALLLPEYATLREAARLLAARTRLLVHEHRFQEAIANQVRGFRLADHAGSDPVLTSYLVGVACDAISQKSMEYILAASYPNAVIAEEVRAAVAQHRTHLSLEHALRGEMGMQTTDFDMIRATGSAHTSSPADLGDTLTALVGEGTMSDQPEDVPVWQQALNLAHRETHSVLHAVESRVFHRFALDIVDESQALCIERMQALLATAARLDRREPAALLDAAQRDANVQANMNVNYGLDQSSVNPAEVIPGVLLPMMSAVGDRATRVNLQDETVLCAADIMAKAARTGSFPASAAGLALPVDPYHSTISPGGTGQTLAAPGLNEVTNGSARIPVRMGYRAEAHGFVLYSVGPDGKFDGGKPGVRPTTQAVYFRFPWPPQQPVSAYPESVKTGR